MIADARGAALEALMRVGRGGASDRALDRTLRRAGLAGRDRALATELTYGVLRRRRRQQQVAVRPVVGATDTSAQLV